MAAKLGEHVIEERQAGRCLVTTFTIEINLDQNRCF
jgi:hypothetical protein